MKSGPPFSTNGSRYKSYATAAVGLRQVSASCLAAVGVAQGDEGFEDLGDGGAAGVGETGSDGFGGDGVGGLGEGLEDGVAAVGEAGGPGRLAARMEDGGWKMAKLPTRVVVGREDWGRESARKCKYLQISAREK